MSNNKLSNSTAKGKKQGEQPLQQATMGNYLHVRGGKKEKKPSVCSSKLLFFIEDCTTTVWPQEFEILSIAHGLVNLVIFIDFIEKISNSYGLKNANITCNCSIKRSITCIYICLGT